MPRTVTAVAAVAWSAGIAALTLTPLPWRPRLDRSAGGVLDLGTWLDAGTWSNGTVTEFSANVLLFVPWAVLLVRLGWPALLVLPLGATFSFAIEVLQLPLPDRASDPRDLVANTLGVAIGVVVGAVANAVSRGGRVAEEPNGRRRYSSSP